ncbi:MAG TPA: toll/interleukin-1 receptor domain-containing protein [Candidatus Rubrimentiphilum sp.]|nr:toll/interleukin-1 receptor domain-containing protein [Candidatus Rubrimentiphilum sp.]
MAHDVFVCYSSEDKTIANAACAKLESAGIRCWMAPRDPIAGIPYGRQLVDAITAARIVLLIFSGNANRSEHVLRELEVASDSGKIIVPFRIENVTPSGDLRYYITRVHWLDAMSPPMESRLNELVALMQRLMDLPITPVVPAASAASTSRKSYPAIAAVVIIAATVAIALGLYFMKHSAAPVVHAIAKATPHPEHTTAAMAKHSARTVSASTPAPPPTPQIIYVPQPQGTPVRLTVVPNVPKTMPAPKPRATSKRPTPAPRAAAAPTAEPTIAARPPTLVQYQLPSGSKFFIRRMQTNWQIGRASYALVGRANIAGTAGTALSAPSGREWVFVPDIGAVGPYARQICFSLAGPGACDANKIFPIVQER